MIKQLIRRWVPPTVLMRARQVAYAPLEVNDLLRGRRDPLTPPRWLHFVGGGDFHTVGERFLNHFRTFGALQPSDSVLDVGCGVGRMALPLAGYLGPDGRYEGFDIVPAGIRWCQRHITPLYPRFRFQHANIYNAEYNPGGHEQPEQFVFPYGDDSFDFIFLTSVFTHMLPAGVANYLCEMKRVLRPHGRILATFFVLDQTALELNGSPGSLFAFRDSGAGYWTTHPDRPEAAIAYREQQLRALVQAAGLRIREPIHVGSWSGRAAEVDGQDIVIIEQGD